MENQISFNAQGRQPKGVIAHRTHPQPLSLNQLVSTMPPAEIIWLRYHTDASYSRKLDYLARLFKANGTAMHVVDLLGLTAAQLIDTDLVILDTSERVDSIIEAVVMRIRQVSKVPIIVVAESYSPDQLVNVLTAGVDMVCSFSDPAEVLVARCKALLRRWLQLRPSLE